MRRCSDVAHRSNERAWVDRRCPSLPVHANHRMIRLTKLEFVRYRRWYTGGVSYLFRRPMFSKKGVRTWTRL